MVRAALVLATVWVGAAGHLHTLARPIGHAAYFQEHTMRKLESAAAIERTLAEIDTLYATPMRVDVRQAAVNTAITSALYGKLPERCRAILRGYALRANKESM